MAVQPIDIQVNFSQMNAVSAEQTMSRHAVLAANVDSTRHVINDSLQRAGKVKKIESEMNEVPIIHDDEEAPAAKSGNKDLLDEKTDLPSSVRRPPVIADDPDKGHEVDLMC